MKHTTRAVFFVVAVIAAAAHAKTLFFIHPDSLYSFDHYNSEKVVAGKKITVKYQIATSIVDFSKDDYTQISPYLITTGAFKKIMSIKVMKYSIYQEFSIKGKKYLEQSTGYFLIDSTKISPIRQVTVRGDNLSNEYYDFNVKDTVPQLTTKNYLNEFKIRDLKYKDLFTEEQLFWVVRFMAEMKLEYYKLYLLSPMVHGLFDEKVYFAEIQFEKEYFRLQGVNTQKVTVTREDGKKAEFWVSQESSKRIFKAHDFRGGWYNLEESTVESMHNWPF